MHKRILKISILIIISLLFAWYFIPGKKLDTNLKPDKILVVKHKRKLYLYSGQIVLKTYRISLGREPRGDKHFQGDNRTPEGIYTINDKNPKSAYHLNLGISYPDKDDIEYAAKYDKSPGGSIKIHGLKNGYGCIGKFHQCFDWTQGCIALTNNEIEELYKNVPLGTVIEIKE